MTALSELTRAVRQLIAQGDRASSDGDQHYKQAGEKLRQLKKNEYKRNRAGLNWPQFVQQHIGISRGYADFLIRVADGRANADEARTRSRQNRQQRVERRENESGRSRPPTSRQQSPGCDSDPYAPEEVAEPGDDPAMVDARILINRLNEIAHQSRVAVGNARRGTTVTDAELRAELNRSLADAIQATEELFERIRGGQHGQEAHQTALH